MAHATLCRKGIGDTTASGNGSGLNIKCNCQFDDVRSDDLSHEELLQLQHVRVSIGLLLPHPLDHRPSKTRVHQPTGTLLRAHLKFATSTKLSQSVPISATVWPMVRAVRVKSINNLMSVDCRPTDSYLTMIRDVRRL